jgi:DNA polymerase-3 subunit delta
MSFNKLLSDFKSKKYQSLYFLDGEESYFIDALSDYLTKHVLEEHEKEFNQSVFYGQDIKPGELIPYVKRFPMMSEYQVIIVREAQNWKLKEDLEGMERLFRSVVPSTILVICYKGKKLDKRSKAYKALKELDSSAVYFTSNKLRDTDIPSWITHHASNRGFDLEPKAAMVLSEHIGNDVGGIVNALEKLEVLASESRRIDSSLVMEHIGISKDFNVFELQKALGKRNAKKALYISNYFANNSKEHNIVPTVVALFRYFSKIMKVHAPRNSTDKKSLASSLGVPPYFVDEYIQAARYYQPHSLREVMEILHDIDLKSKGVNSSRSDSGELTRELVVRILRA